MARSNRKSTQSKPERPQTKADEPRLFIAAPLPDPVLDHLGHLLDDLCSRNLPVRWTAPNALHLTLHFVGETPPERAELLRMSFASLAPRTGSIRLHIGQLGVFPNQKRPRVLWIGLDGQTEPLGTLYREVGAMLDRLGFPVEERSFRPHLTLGRARDNVDQLFPYQLGEAFEAQSVREIVSAPVDFAISEVRLYRSHLERSGARYETLATVSL
jgi:RNA 2',3'-cyclic 3'-phosphodiesterase